MANLASPLRPLRLRIYRKVRKVFAKYAKGKRSNDRRGVVYQTATSGGSNSKGSIHFRCLVKTTKLSSHKSCKHPLAMVYSKDTKK